MSLEQQIEQLNSNIERLIAVMGENGAPTREVTTKPTKGIGKRLYEYTIEPSPSVVPEAEKSKAPAAVSIVDYMYPDSADTPPVLTHEQVRKVAVDLATPNKGNQHTRVKELIAEYGAAKLQDVPEDKLPELKAKLEQALKATEWGQTNA